MIEFTSIWRSSQVTVYTEPKSARAINNSSQSLLDLDISNNRCPWPNFKDGSRPWPKITSPRSMSLCSHTCIEIRVQAINSLLPCLIFVICHTVTCIYCPYALLKDASWPWPKIIFPRSRSQRPHSRNQCPCHLALTPLLGLNNILHNCCQWSTGAS